ncbi:hypothetical protein DFH07DRAFT_954696 [Mycena maculata]|uniref:Uncharacterized protein n=1 Tax=Mycena maculata TaxID=230809 RepID=A0AAD7JPX0_9AGAR|nr:hypothetical protein DFH07DRAFT_954696 [Mycena maculata]
MPGLLVRFSVATLLVSRTAVAGPPHARRAVAPVVASTTSYGYLDSGDLDRDSCIIRDRLWTCRDTQQISSAGVSQLPLIANTASLSGLPSDPSDPQTLVLTSPAFGSLFYALESDECPAYGVCSDGTRWVGWPNTGPVVTFSDGGVNAYAFMGRQHLSGIGGLVKMPRLPRTAAALTRGL